MGWQDLLHELHGLALKIPNRNAASEDILAYRDMVIEHTTNDHWEALNPEVERLVGWGNQKSGYLSKDSSRADFMAVYGFMYEFCRVESRVSSGSCIGSMIPRIEKSIKIWCVYCS